jgi:hypothetical protein
MWESQRKQAYTPLTANIRSYNNHKWVKLITAMHILLFIWLWMSLSARKRVTRASLDGLTGARTAPPQKIRSQSFTTLIPQSLPKTYN